MQYNKKIGSIFLFLLLFGFSRNISLAQSEGRSINPPPFPKCETKLGKGIGDVSHIAFGTKDVPIKGFVEGIHDIYKVNSDSFLGCTCPKDETTGIESDFWGIDSLPLGQVDIDAYKRVGWTYEDTGISYGFGSQPFLIQQREFSCNIKRASASLTPTSVQNPSTDELPETGLPLEAFFGFIIFGEVGYILYKKFRLV